MSDTYGDFPGVDVTTVSKGTLRPDMSSIDMSDKEYRLVAIIIMMTHSDTFGFSVDIDVVSGALKCYGYTDYEIRPMVWETLREIGQCSEEWEDYPAS